MTYEMEENMKKVYLRYFTYILLIFLYLTCREYAIKKMNHTSFEDTIHSHVIMLLLNIGVGIILGLERFTKEIKKDGLWKIYWPKVILMTIPLFYFSFAPLLQFLRNETIREALLLPFNSFFQISINFIPILQIMFGYFLITDFYKKEERINLNRFINQI